MKIKNGFTPEQAEALAKFEEAAEHQDLSAIGHNRRYRANECVAYWYDKVVSFGVADALTQRETSIALAAKAHIS